MWRFLIMVVTYSGSHWSVGQFLRCHDDPSYTPYEGPLDDAQFTWLGTLQYIHIKNGTPHYFRVPRVVLITRQFVLSAAKDAAEVPEGFALGNIGFGDYERDDTECGLTAELVVGGAGGCEPAALLVPVADVMLHPEYPRRSDSVALMKMITQIRSEYMVPVCLPYKNYLLTKTGDNIKDTMTLVDFGIDVPRDMMQEDKEISILSILPKELCALHADKKNVTDIDEFIICTTGCGYHLGAPSVVHERTGHWTLVALSLGGSPCPDPLRGNKPSQSPRHLLIHPYVSWITTTISGKSTVPFASDDPFGFFPQAARPPDLDGREWNGHWWMGGLACYDRGDAAQNMFKFYREVFQVIPKDGDTRLTYYLEIIAAYDTTINCVKVGMPFQLAKPKVWGLDSSEAKVRIPVLLFKGTYKFQVEAFASNATKDNASQDSQSSSESEQEG